MSSASPTVSIGICFRNPGPPFRLAVQSALLQSFDDFELLLIDDGSTDGAVEWAQKLTDERVRVYCDNKSQGLARRLNEVATRASGRYLLRMDADDVMVRDRVAVVHERLSNEANIDVLGSRAYMIDEQNRLRGLFVEPELTGSASSLTKISFTHPTVAARTEWFRENPYNPAFLRGQDKELWARTSSSSSFRKIDQPLLYYRVKSRMTKSAYQAYAGSKKADRDVAMLHAGDRGQLAVLGKVVLPSYLKQGIWLGARTLGLDGVLVSRLAQALPDAERERAQTELDAMVAATEASLPAWP